MAAQAQLSPLETDAELIRLAGRMTYGVNRPTAEAVRNMGYEQFVEWQLDYESIDDSELENALKEFLPTLSLTTAELIGMVRDQDGTDRDMDLIQQARRELLVATQLRQVFSPRQLYERMVEFWSDHFNAPVVNQISGLLKPAEVSEVIRPLALERFEDLLLADARSPAMLYYLDNFVNTADGPNENYSRELMELHTLGVNGGYTEDDVKEASRLFTGWTFNRNGSFVFDRRNHDYGQKEVLGEIYGSGRGVVEGERFLSFLAEHPSTANHLASKLIRRFVTDQPEERLVEEIAEAFTSSGGDIRETMRTLLLHPDVCSAPATKLKRPNEFVAGVLRGYEMAPRPNTLRAVFEALESAGQPLFQWPAPNGYPDVRPYWQSTTGFLMRFNTATQWSAAVSGLSPLLLEANRVKGNVNKVSFLASALVPRGVDSESQKKIDKYIAPLPRDDRPAAIASLLLAGPDFQWR